MSSKEKFEKLIIYTDMDLHTLYEIYLYNIKDRNFIIYDLIYDISKYTDIIKDNNFDLNSRVVIGATIDLILAAHDILMYIKDASDEEEICKEIVVEIMNKIISSWKQILTSVDNKLLIKILIEKMIKMEYCSKSTIHISLE